MSKPHCDTDIEAIRDRAWNAAPPRLGNDGPRVSYAADRNLDLELDEVKQVPTLTLAGTIWMHAIRPPHKGSAVGDVCEHCAMEGHCRDAVMHGDFVACEKPLRKEML